jgi:hypothetical protein
VEAMAAQVVQEWGRVEDTKASSLDPALVL